MNEIIQSVWLGDLPTAMNTQQLRDNKIRSVLSVMRAKLKINQTFIHHQIQLDDTQDADMLSQFLPAIYFIEGELEKGRPVLVHCHAGISRSPTIVAAYLVYTLNITPKEALDKILEKRPFVQPNPNFVRQLNLFHYSQGKTSRNDTDIRRFYLERTVHQVKNGDGTSLTTEILPEVSGPTTPRQRRIRCKRCRQGLATPNHMLHHGQLEPITHYPSQADTQRLSDCGPQLNSTSHSNLPTSDATISRQTVCEGKFVSDSDKNDKYTSSNSPTSDVAANPDSTNRPSPITRLKGPSDLASELYNNPTLAALRIPSSSASRHPDREGSQAQQHSPPILTNPKCSGYFIEPMKWMDHFLFAGTLVGKITCPNTKCNAKLGNYDWAGVCCGCKVWVTPGFCINRSKVDEVE